MIEIIEKLTAVQGLIITYDIPDGSFFHMSGEDKALRKAAAILAKEGYICDNIGIFGETPETYGSIAVVTQGSNKGFFIMPPMTADAVDTIAGALGARVSEIMEAVA